jgi:nucleoid-associated protein YgaU
MSVEKLTIWYQQKIGMVTDYTGSIKALFNPNSISFSKSVNWSKVNGVTKKNNQTWKMQYSDTTPETMDINLFFDTYEQAGALKGTIWWYFLKTPTILDHTKKLAQLARLDEDLHRPPKCILQWGRVTLFTGVLTSLKQNYTLFLEDGTPVRGTADCTFTEVAMDSDKTRYELNSPDVDKTYVVRPGDTLDRIAAELYEDRTRWRVIAEANGIDNPRNLIPGQILHIPKLR